MSPCFQIAEHLAPAHACIYAILLPRRCCEIILFSLFSPKARSICAAFSGGSQPWSSRIHSWLKQSAGQPHLLPQREQPQRLRRFPISLARTIGLRQTGRAIMRTAVGEIEARIALLEQPREPVSERANVVRNILGPNL